MEIDWQNIAINLGSLMTGVWILKRWFFDPVKSEIKETNNKIERLDEKLSTKIDAVDKRLSTKIDAVDKRLSEKIDAVDKRLSEKIDAVDKKLSAQIEKIDKRLMRVEHLIEFSGKITYITRPLNEEYKEN